MRVNVQIQRGIIPDTPDTDKISNIAVDWYDDQTPEETLSAASLIGRQTIIKLAAIFRIEPSKLSQEIADQLAG